MADLNLIFNNIYKDNKWGGTGCEKEGNGSGIGSEPSTTIVLQDILIEFMKSKACKSILDSPCGACKWTQHMIARGLNEVSGFKYCGVDIAPEAIQRAAETLGGREFGANIKLELKNMCTDLLAPNYDVILCRDALQHLSHVNITKALINFASTPGVVWILLGGYPNGKNTDIIDGEYFDFNPTAEPYCLMPERVFDEQHPVQNHAPKHLFVYHVDYFKSRVSSLKIKTSSK